MSISSIVSIVCCILVCGCIVRQTIDGKKAHDKICEYYRKYYRNKLALDEMYHNERMRRIKNDSCEYGDLLMEEDESCPLAETVFPFDD